MSYAFGEPVSLTLNAADGNPAVLANYAEVVLTIIQPDGTSLTRTKTGGTLVANPYVFSPTQVGRHVYYYVTTTPNGATEPEPFDVEAAGSAAIVSLADVKKHLNLTTVTNDDELRAFVSAASETIEGLVGPVSRRTFTETLDASGPVVVLSHPPVIEVTAISEWTGTTGYPLTPQPTGDSTVDSYGYDLNGDAGLLFRRTSGYAGTWVTGPRSVTVTYTAGRTTVPAAIRLATLKLVKHMWGDQRGASLPLSAVGDQFESPVTAHLVPWEVEELLAPYRTAPAVA